MITNFSSIFFPDLKVICKNDYDCNGISLHKAILASCSKFLSSILLDGRDETTVFLPEVDKEDFHNLVRNLYGEKGTKRPSQELLTLLQISELPEIGKDSAPTTLTTKVILGPTRNLREIRETLLTTCKSPVFKNNYSYILV